MSLSGHGDCRQLTKLIAKSMNPKKLKKVIIVHGGEEEREHMIQEISEHVSGVDVLTLKEEETIRF